jgi:Na+/H+ antiporter NhaB
MGDSNKATGSKKWFQYTLKINRDHLQEDGRKLAVSAFTAALVGIVLESDLFYFRDALGLLGLSVIIWLLVYVEPTDQKGGGDD